MGRVMRRRRHSEWRGCDRGAGRGLCAWWGLMTAACSIVPFFRQGGGSDAVLRVLL